MRSNNSAKYQKNSIVLNEDVSYSSFFHTLKHLQVYMAFNDGMRLRKLMIDRRGALYSQYGCLL